ncbi:MAG: hypothetical protein HY354_02705, partial [Planctomycetes bacterium]|nr:hypothetical protein [Planctomycetota bacterium]
MKLLSFLSPVTYNLSPVIYTHKLTRSLIFAFLFLFTISTSGGLALATCPTLLGNYNTPGYAYNVYVSGTTAFVADDSSGLQIINVTNPAIPALLGNY